MLIPDNERIVSFNLDSVWIVFVLVRVRVRVVSVSVSIFGLIVLTHRDDALWM